MNEFALNGAEHGRVVLAFSAFFSIILSQYWIMPLGNECGLKQCMAQQFIAAFRNISSAVNRCAALLNPGIYANIGN